MSAGRGTARLPVAPAAILRAARVGWVAPAGAMMTGEPDRDRASRLIGGRAVIHPDFDPLLPFQDPDTNDIAVVPLDEPVTDVGLAGLPSAVLHEALAGEREERLSFTAAGYGAAGLLPGGGPPGHDFRSVRLAATTSLVTLRSALTDGFNLEMTSVPGGGQGGVCFGDSGGAVLLARSNTVVGFSSFLLSLACTGGAFAFRLDTEAAPAFPAPYLSH